MKASHRVRAAARRISRDRLAIRKVHDDKQRDDRRADGNYITNAEKAKRKQKAQRRFGSVRGRTQAVETKDRDTLRRTDLLRPFVTGLEGLADNQIKNINTRVIASLPR